NRHFIVACRFQFVDVGDADIMQSHRKEFFRRKIVIAQAAHGADETAARREFETADAIAVFHQAVENDRPGFPGEGELNLSGGVRVETSKVLQAKGHAPVPAAPTFLSIRSVRAFNTKL